MIKNILTGLLAVFVIASIIYLIADKNINNKTESNELAAKTEIKSQAPVNKEIVNAYYFHSSIRCYTCNLMERYIRETIAKHFSGQVKDGNLLFESVNIDEPQNKHFIDDYKLHTKTLILSLMKDKKEIKWINCDKIWSLVSDENKFKEYIQVEINKYLEI